MRLYTRSGDDGSTALFGGGRVGKDHPRVIAFGEVDELNAALGLVMTVLDTPKGNKPGHREAPPRGTSALMAIQDIVVQLQSRLFDLGADLATPIAGKHESKIQRISADHVAQAEGWIDVVDSGNTPMNQFVLPGGTELAARLHLARTICRRAERAMVHLSGQEQVNNQAIVFINRISDLLFAMARRANKEAGVADVPWTPGT